MGGQTALPMAGSGQQAGGTPLGGTPIGGTPGISPMGQPPIQTQAMLAQPGYSAPTGMGSAASALSQLQAAQNMMQGMPGQMGQPGMGQPNPLAGMTQQQLQQHYGLFPAAQPAGQPGMGQPFPGMGQPGMGRSPGMPAAPPGSHERFLQGLTGGQLQEALQGQLAKTAEINARANSGQPGTPPGLGVTQQQLQQLQRAQASPMQRPEMAGGMPQQRPGFNMPQRFQDRLPPQFSQGLGALAQNMRNRIR